MTAFMAEYDTAARLSMTWKELLVQIGTVMTICSLLPPPGHRRAPFDRYYGGNVSG